MTQLQRWREARGYSKAELSRRSGVARPDIANVEAGARPLYPKWRGRLATALETTPDQL
jgi:transcriptional regulator with XRE-family HTH domain